MPIEIFEAPCLEMKLNGITPLLRLRKTIRIWFFFCPTRVPRCSTHVPSARTHCIEHKNQQNRKNNPFLLENERVDAPQPALHWKGAQGWLSDESKLLACVRLTVPNGNANCTFFLLLRYYKDPYLGVPTNDVGIGVTKWDCDLLILKKNTWMNGSVVLFYIEKTLLGQKGLWVQLIG